jgi:hypothetical protein
MTSFFIDKGQFGKVSVNYFWCELLRIEYKFNGFLFARLDKGSYTPGTFYFLNRFEFIKDVLNVPNDFCLAVNRYVHPLEIDE